MLATIIIGLIVLGIAALAVRSMYKNKKAGKTCGCGCSNCANEGICHSKEIGK